MELMLWQIRGQLARRRDANHRGYVGAVSCTGRLYALAAMWSGSRLNGRALAHTASFALLSLCNPNRSSFFNAAAHQAGIANTTLPGDAVSCAECRGWLSSCTQVVSAWLSQENKFAFVEFRTMEEVKQPQREDTHICHCH